MSFELPDQHTIHETEGDRERQQIIIKAFAKRFGYTVEFTPQLHEQDAKLYKNGALAALAEAKYRNNSIGLYANYKVDCQKVDSLKERAKAAGVPGYLIVSWEGDIRWVDVTEAWRNWSSADDLVWDIGSIKRRNRAEEADPAYCIPTDEKTFIRL